MNARLGQGHSEYRQGLLDMRLRLKTAVYSPDRTSAASATCRYIISNLPFYGFET